MQLQAHADKYLRKVKDYHSGNGNKYLISHSVSHMVFIRIPTTFFGKAIGDTTKKLHIIEDGVKGGAGGRRRKVNIYFCVLRKYVKRIFKCRT